MIRPLTAFCGLLLLLGASAWAQTVQPIQTTSGGGTCSFGNVANGSLIVVFANSEGALTLPTSLRGETWSLVESNAANVVFAYGWVGTTTSGGAETVTLTGSLVFAACVSAEFPGSYGWTVDGAAHTNGIPPGNTFTTSNITTVHDGDLILGFASGDIYQSSPYLDGHVNNDSGGAGYYISGTNGSYSMTFNGFNGSTYGGYVIFAMKPSALAITTPSLPSSAANAAYSYTLHAVGGIGAYTWSLASGSLPSGVSLNSSTGVLSGTPTGLASSPVFQVTDGSSTATASLALTVNASAGTPSVVNENCGSGPILNTTSGNLLIFEQDSLGPFAAPTDTVGTPYKLIGVFGNPVFQNTAMLKFALYSGIAAGSNATNTISQAGCAVQLTNVQNFWDTLAFTSGNSAATASISGPSITTSAPKSMIWAGVDASITATTFTATAPFTLDIDGAGGTPLAGAHNLEFTVGSYTPAFTQNGNTDGRWIIGALALRPITGGVVGSVVARHKTPIF